MDSRQAKRDMHHPGLAPRRHWQAAVLEHLQHRCVVRQNLRDELVKARVTGDRGQMAQQHGAETAALKLIDHGEGPLGASGLQHDVAPTADDLLSAVVVSQRSTLRKNAISRSVKLRLAAKKRR